MIHDVYDRDYAAFHDSRAIQCLQMSVIRIEVNKSNSSTLIIKYLCPYRLDA